MIGKIRKNKGFTLIELSIVLVVVGIMLYAGLSIGSIQLDAAKTKQTKDKLDKIERALQLYYETNNKLPCPADGAADLADGDFGVGTASADNGAVSDTTCTSVTAPIIISAATVAYVGVVPVRTLELPDDFMYDGWDDRITYVVAKNCVDKDNWVDLEVNKCTTGADGNADGNFDEGGNLNVRDNTSNSNRTLYGVYVLVSHGKNSYGAFPDVGGSQIDTGSPAPSASEAFNAKLSGTTPTYTNLYYQDDAIADYDGVANYFDDLVRWKTGPQMGYEKLN